MRLLIDADDPKVAEKLLDRLVAEKIEAEVRPAGGTELWVIDETEMERARELISQDPRDDRAVASRAAEVRRAKQRADEDQKKRLVGEKPRLGAPIALGMGPLTLLLMACSLTTAFLQYTSDDPNASMWVFTIDHWESLEILGRVRQGEVWRLVTPMFLHFGLIHLGFNMIWLYRFGRELETNHGTVTMLVLVLVSELVGNLGQYALSGPAFGGMSGVNYALFGFVWMNARYHRRYTYQISDGETVLLMAWFVLCATGWVGPIANIGHAGGLIVGLLFGVPPFLRHVRVHGSGADFSEGSWADVHLTGLRRFSRRFVRPYIPLWFLAIAAAVIALEQPTHSPFASRTVEVHDPEPIEFTIDLD